MVTNINTLGFVFTVIMSVLIIMLPRRYATIPLFMVTSYITLGQQAVIAGLNFSIMRILILFGWIRLLIRRELHAFSMTPIDNAIILWVISNVTIYVLRTQNFATFINRMGFAYNTLGIYFLFRYLIRNFEEIQRTFKILAIISMPLACAMVIEYTTAGRNMFSIFGGVPKRSWIRDGRIRCQGPFRHAILAGTFGATLMPFFLTLWFEKKHLRKYAVIGIISSSVITFTSVSSGPLMSYLFEIAALLMWPFRERMKTVKWAILVSLVCLHLIMKAPIWYLFTRVSSVLGGTGWHRADLIDTAIRHFNEWWLLGTSYTAHWMHTTLPDNPNMIDITSGYILQGVEGGLLTMALFILTIVRCFNCLGEMLKAFRGEAFAVKITFWAMGAALLGHVMTLFSVAYFDQILVSWYLVLALISTTYGFVRVSRAVSQNNRLVSHVKMR